MGVCAKFEGCAAKTVGVGFLRVRVFQKKKRYCQILPHSCQLDGTDFKLGKHVKKLSMMLHYKFHWGCTLNIAPKNNKPYFKVLN